MRPKNIFGLIFLLVLPGLLILPGIRDILAVAGIFDPLSILILVGIYTVLALGLNIVVGLAGLLALGFAAFYGIGAYTVAILNLNFGLGFWWAVLPAVIIGAGFGLLLGIPALRLRGDYLAIVTLGFGEIVRLLFLNWVELTRGPMGMPGIESPRFSLPNVPAFIFGETPLKIGGLELPLDTPFYYLILIFCILAAIVLVRLSRSRIGRAWVAIREDEVAARAMGVDTVSLKVYAFALSAALAALAGAFYASYTRFVGPTSFTFLESVTILCMVVLGGRGSIGGVILGAALITVLPELLRGFVEYRMLIFGLLLVVMMIFRPQGFMGTKY